MVDKFSATLKSIVAAIHAVLGFVLSAGLALGLIVPNSTENPIVFENSDECLMSFVALADTHTRETKINTFYLECGLNDIANSEEEFDALLIAGDLTEFGDGISYNALWDKLDNSVFADKPILLATGNHDIRLAYEAQTAMIMQKAGEYLDMDINKPYYSYDVNGYTFIVMGSDEWQLEKAIISDEQLEFLDSELERATRDGKPAFVVCHQPLADTHGLPEVWENGDLGEDSSAVFDVLVKYENVFFINGHLHDGVYENSLEVFDEENGVYSINLPAYGRENDYGAFPQPGLGDYVEVYADRVVFTARDFQAGQPLEGMSYTFYLK